ncbi:RNA polymerase sigma-70 factor [Streptomyces cheonanensis]|uniref:RNA polymerase sigma-70 factor n=1 Tax=Streptomyces cheonanensis TaxID=312720 RepID=A0ABP5GLC2_9ACTN|nr:RNA polymerase sigma factor SigJ [Streptomyces harbinensis]QKV67650.1 RNA polymerase sigma factor SigJ [Streptomyces harbinensis]
MLAGVEEDALEIFEEHRGLLFGVAYRMLGAVADAEDIVQETWLRWSGARGEEVRHPRAYLVRITTRLAVERLHRLREARETYPGNWLPEPLPTAYATVPAGAPGAAEAGDAAAPALRAESVSLAVLVVLESLSPLERAVFVLREAFGFPYREIAEVLGRGEAAVRQLAGRARQHVAERRPRFTVDPVQRRDLTERFLAAATQGDLDGLLALLATGVQVVGDGGGRGKAPLRVIADARKAGRFFTGIAGRAPAEFAIRPVELNGGPALLITSGGVPHSVFQLEVADGLVQRVYLQANPDKLRHLAGVAGVAGA